MIEETGEKIIADLTDAAYMIGIGTYQNLNIEATVDDRRIAFHHNLGGFNVPTREQATEKIRVLQEYYHKLRDASAAFRAFSDGRIFEAELYVFSGQMDFPIAVSRDDCITWKTELE
jgi:hypothetical protein